MADCLCLASPNTVKEIIISFIYQTPLAKGENQRGGQFYCQRPLYSLRSSRSVSRFFMVSRLSSFFLPLTKAISTLIFLFLLYTEIGTIVKFIFSLPASSVISFLVSKSFLLRSGS